MQQEYLFDDMRLKNVVDTSDVYIFRNTIIEKNDIMDTDYWILKISTLGDNENSAKVLSEIHQYIVKKYNVDVLTNESSTYFCRRLFPLINEFEFRLRKLLYLSSISVKEYVDRDVIKNIETLDFGKIFEILFIDRTFISAAKESIKNRNWLFTKKELIERINTIEESTIWDKLKCSDMVYELKNNYMLVKSYRNDVMHAHSIDYNSFIDAKKIFKKINNQLNNAINKLLGENITDQNTTNIVNFANLFSDAINKNVYVSEIEDTDREQIRSLVLSLISEKLQNGTVQIQTNKEKSQISNILSKMYDPDYDKIISDVKTEKNDNC